MSLLGLWCYITSGCRSGDGSTLLGSFWDDLVNNIHHICHLCSTDKIFGLIFAQKWRWPNTALRWFGEHQSSSPAWPWISHMLIGTTSCPIFFSASIYVQSLDLRNEEMEFVQIFGKREQWGRIIVFAGWREWNYHQAVRRSESQSSLPQFIRVYFG